MKYLVLEYMKNLQLGSYDINRGFMANDHVILDVSKQKKYDHYDEYLKEKRNHFAGMQFVVKRCDDFDDNAIVWAEIQVNNAALYDYIGYFKTDETAIHRIDELWCERKQE